LTSIDDGLLIRCPRLGGEVTFGYCVAEGGDLPCMRIIACWQRTVPVTEYLQGYLTPEQQARFAGKEPKEKITSLIELIESVKRSYR
jgi:hypothetical protein